MEKASKSIQLIIIVVLTVCAVSIGHAQDDESFPFDKPCLKYDKATFKPAGALLDIMIKQDFPQYCEVYSLSNYQVDEKWGEGYFLTSVDPKDSQTTKVFLKTKKTYQKGDLLKTSAYFTGEERFDLDKGGEAEFYTFQELDF